MEAVLGAYGGQLASFDWTFSPRGEDGRPQPMFDRATGAVDPAVIAYWAAHYDLAASLARLTPADRRAITGNLHLWVGSVDSNYLDEAVRKFAAAAKSAGVDAALTIVPGRTHFDLYTKNGDPLGFSIPSERRWPRRRTGRQRYVSPPVSRWQILELPFGKTALSGTGRQMTDMLERSKGTQ